MFRISILSLLLCALLQISTGCGGNDAGPEKAQDTPTSGHLKVFVDEGYRPLIQSTVDVFDSIYRLAKIEPFYTHETNIVKNLIDDSVSVAIIARNLTPEEVETFKHRGFTPKYTCFAKDAVAFILNPANPDTVFTVEQIKNIITGQAPSWKNINPKSKLGNIQMVFDHQGSGTVRYLKDTIGGGTPLPANASALKTNEEVIAYVAKNKDAIGIISNNWISDTDDKGVQAFTHEIKLAAISKTSGAESFIPAQAYIATGEYPFVRGIYIINAQGRAFGLGAGFASFLASERGQRIVLKEGLLPVTMPIRLIKPQRK